MVISLRQIEKKPYSFYTHNLNNLVTLKCGGKTMSSSWRSQLDFPLISVMSTKIVC